MLYSHLCIDNPLTILTVLALQFPAQRQHHLQQHRRIVANTLHGQKLFKRCIAHPVQIAEALQQAVSQRIDIPLRNRIKQQQFQHHMRFHMLQPVPQELLFQALPVARMNILFLSGFSHFYGSPLDFSL